MKHRYAYQCECLRAEGTREEYLRDISAIKDIPRTGRDGVRKWVGGCVHNVLEQKAVRARDGEIIRRRLSGAETSAAKGAALRTERRGNISSSDSDATNHK